MNTPSRLVSSSRNVQVGHVQSCQLCAGDLELILDLGFHAPCDSLSTREQLDEMERTYPLRFVRCRECGLAQIDHVVAPAELFYADYPYRSGITETLKKNLMGIAQVLVKNLGLAKGSFVIDLGSNDGTTLQGFKKEGMRVLGVEPTNIAQIAIANGVPTIQKFFSEATAAEITETHGKATVVTANNVFAHIPNLEDLIRGVEALLVEDGIFLTESHYLPELLKSAQYDSIYHEHLKYYSARTLCRLFDNYDFTVVDAERISNYGGSIRLYARKGRGHRLADRLRTLLADEDRFMTDEAGVYRRFVEKVHRSKWDLLALLLDIRKQGKRVVGIGCPGRCSTLLNYCGIGPGLLRYIAEQPDCLKVGMFLPGRHIPIVDEKIMLEESPDYAVMLSWHYFRPIVDKLRQKGLTSKIILPLPEVRILEDG